MVKEGRRGGVPGDHGVRARDTGDHADRLDGGGRRDRGGGCRCGQLSSEGGRYGPSSNHDEERGCGPGASADRGGEAGLRRDSERGEIEGRQPDPEGEGDTRVVVPGMSYVAIAEASGVKEVTIQNAIYTIQVKLGVDSKQEVVVWAAQNGLLDD